MKALIFNSGIGKRMGVLTANSPKSMVHLYNDEPIFERQIRLLQEAGITEIIVTTGPYPEMIKSVCSKACYKNIRFFFPHNEIYDSSNYIYSMFKAKELLDDDILMMHGDLVFDRSLVPNILKNPIKNICLINKNKELPEKDFKGRIINNELREVSVNIFDQNCYAFQPMYKLSKEVITAWVDNVVNYVNNGIINVYAENALNEIAACLKIRPISYSNHFIDEVDNPNDLERVNREIEKWDYKKQIIETKKEYLLTLKTRLKKINSSKPFIVADKFLLKDLSIKLPNAVIFSRFTPNPKYEEMLEGLSLFKEQNCDAIVSIGGGSSIDVAKVIKYSLNLDANSESPTFKQNYKYTDIKHICIPTTSGTGSESTKHAVLYLNGVKQSISHPSLLPDYVILCAKLIMTVPEYQKRCTALDAFCQCVESICSRNSTPESEKYATKGIRLFMNCLNGYLHNNYESIKEMQLAANYSGKAINISKTTAAHALSYKLTSTYNIPHGHVVALCMYRLSVVIQNKASKRVLKKLSIALDVNTSSVGSKINELIDFVGLDIQIIGDKKDVPFFVNDVNLERLTNFCIKLSKKDIYNVYTSIIK